MANPEFPKSFRDRKKITQADQSQYQAIRNLICGILSNSEMSMIELIDCLASDPYNIDLIKNLEYIARAMENIEIRGWLATRFVPAKNELTIITTYRLRTHPKN